MSAVRCGPFVRGFTRSPAMRNIGRDSAAIVGCAFRYDNAITFFDGLSNASGNGAASNAATTSGGGTRYFGVSAARVVARRIPRNSSSFRVMSRDCTHAEGAATRRELPTGQNLREGTDGADC